MKLTCICLMTLTLSVFGVKKQDPSLFDYGNANDPDKNKDFKMSTTEIRNWCPSFVRVHYKSPALTQKFPAAVRAFKESDQDEDGELSSSEYREFTKKMKDIFEKVYAQFEKDYDENKNGRIDKSELIKARGENSEYFTYAVAVTEEMHVTEKGENPIVKNKPVPPKALDDIYE